MKNAEKVIQWIGFVPLLGPMGVIFYYVKARLYLGYFPNPGVPDPKDLPFDATYEMVNSIAGAAFYLEFLILASMLILVIRSILSYPTEEKTLYLLLTGRVLFWAFLFTTIFEWFVD